MSCIHVLHTVESRTYEPVPFGQEHRFSSRRWAIRRFRQTIPAFGLRRATYFLYRELRRPRTEVDHDDSSCHDCLTPAAGWHHAQCDTEICPVDGLQALLCDLCPERGG